MHTRGHRQTSAASLLPRIHLYATTVARLLECLAGGPSDGSDAVVVETLFRHLHGGLALVPWVAAWLLQGLASRVLSWPGALRQLLLPMLDAALAASVPQRPTAGPSGDANAQPDGASREADEVAAVLGLLLFVLTAGDMPPGPRRLADTTRGASSALDAFQDELVAFLHAHGDFGALELAGARRRALLPLGLSGASASPPGRNAAATAFPSSSAETGAPIPEALAASLTALQVRFGSSDLAPPGLTLCALTRHTCA